MAEIFVPRLKAPAKTDKNYYSDKNPFYAQTDGKGGRPLMMPNCTAYVYGRLMELTGKTFEGLIGGDARTWYSKAAAAGLKTGKTPKLGAVCCWGVTDGGAGHISVVEQIKENGDIVTSNSAYEGREFYIETLTAASGYNYAPTRVFQGFIYCGAEFAQDGADASGAEKGGSGTSAGRLTAGAELMLNSTPCYTTETSAASYDRKTGKYYLWDAETRNGRVRITNRADRVGKDGQVTCWINAADVGLTADGSDGAVSFKTGVPYELKNIPVYDSETGETVGKRTGTYYLWSAETKNGRVRMTNDKGRAGRPGQVSFWVDKTSLK